jgi:hypothetical protein
MDTVNDAAAEQQLKQRARHRAIEMALAQGMPAQCVVDGLQAIDAADWGWESCPASEVMEVLIERAIEEEERRERTARSRTANAEEGAA